MSLLRAEHLSKHFRLGREVVRAVDNVTFSLAAGEVLGVVGESGCGKSTLGRTLVGLHAPTAGCVLWHGQPLPAPFRTRDHQRFARYRQMIFQDPMASLNPRLTVSEIVTEGLRFTRRGRPAERRAVARDWLERVGLSAAALDRYPHEFSGGQQQRIGIARALIMEPELLVCDEPLSALDVSVQAQVVNLLSDLRDAMGLGMLFIAHDLAMVRFLADRVLVMYLGTVVEAAPTERLFSRPAHPYTQLLMASNPEPDPACAGGLDAPVSDEGPGAATAEVAVGCRFHPRCPRATEQCRREAPPLLSREGGHEVACFHPD